MPRYDLVLLHAPSVYDFRKQAIMYGPISDLIPTTPVFEMYPIGFINLLGLLQQYGHKARIVNIPMKMLEDPKFDVEAMIKGLDSEAFGIDLHWLVHAQGSLEIARIVKKYHPDAPVILGGLSSTYFHDYLLKNYSHVDYILRGDSTEQPLLQLMNCIEKGASPDDVPNVTWREPTEKIHVNPLSYVPASLDDWPLNYEAVVESIFQSMDLTGCLPSLNWLEYPLLAFLICKGCMYDCVTCGGSRYAYSRICNRSRIATKSPEKLVEEMEIVRKYITAPMYLVGDPFMNGSSYAESILSAIKRAEIENPIVIELFRPINKTLLEKISKSIPNFNLSISPESHDEKVRRAFGRPYGNSELEKMVVNALELGCQRFDLFFMIGLPYQTRESVLETIEYCRMMIERYGKSKNLHTFISPLAPFLDPGSIAFENPEKHGYQILFNSFEEHRRALLAPSWKYTLSFQTLWMKRDDITEVTYEAAFMLNRVKAQSGLIDSDTAKRISLGIRLVQNLMRKIDGVMKIKNRKLRALELLGLKSQMEKVNQRLLCSEDELLVWSTKPKTKDFFHPPNLEI